MSGDVRDRKGRWGEAVVAEYLRDRGFTVTAERYRTRYGEIYLIAENGTFLLFVEVKLRTGRGPVSGREAVDAGKQRRLRTTAEVYLSQNPTDKQPRFDVAEVCAPCGLDTKSPAITYIENAF